MSESVVEHARRMLAAASPGPWHWDGHKDRRSGPYLARWVHGQGLTTVMDFVRLGMRGAQPRFLVDHLMREAVDMAVLEVPYRTDVVDIDHPDARLIAAAPMLIAGLLAEIDRLNGEGGKS